MFRCLGERKASNASSGVSDVHLNHSTYCLRSMLTIMALATPHFLFCRASLFSCGGTLTHISTFILLNYSFDVFVSFFTSVYIYG